MLPHITITIRLPDKSSRNGPSNAAVLAAQAVPRGAITQEQFKAMVDAATDALAKAQETYVNEPGPVDEAAKLLSDMVAMGDEIGLSAN